MNERRPTHRATSSRTETKSVGLRYKKLTLSKSNIHEWEKRQILPRIPCDFLDRPEDERRAFICVTWCDSCSIGSLGMLEPIEYKLGDKTYLEGKCARCGSTIISEIIPKEESGGDVDIISPIQDPSKPALTYLPRNFSPSPFKRGYTDWVYPNLQGTGQLGLPLKIAFWIIALIGIFCIILNIAHTMTNG